MVVPGRDELWGGGGTSSIESGAELARMSFAETRNGWGFSSVEETDFSSTGGSDVFPKWCAGTEGRPTGVWHEE